MKHLVLLLILFCCSCSKEIDRAREAEYVSFTVLNSNYYRAERFYMSRGHYIDVNAYWKIKVVSKDTIYYLNFSKNPHFKKDSTYHTLILR